MKNRYFYVLISIFIPILTFGVTKIIFSHYAKELESFKELESIISNIKTKFKNFEQKLHPKVQNFINFKLNFLAQESNLFCKIFFLIGLITFIICIILSHLISNLLLKYSLIDGGFFAFIVSAFFHPCLLSKSLYSILLWLILISYIAFYEYYSRRTRNVRQVDSTYLP